jgi:hypothetical protein
LGDDWYVGDVNVYKEGDIVRVRTYKDYGHSCSELLLCDMSADVDESTGTSSV